jgi:hypothetical protein
MLTIKTLPFLSEEEREELLEELVPTLSEKEAKNLHNLFQEDLREFLEEEKEREKEEKTIEEELSKEIQKKETDAKLLLLNEGHE